MRLPNVENVMVEERKLTGYLLAFDHPEGAGKAEFFHRAGFTITGLSALSDALVRHAEDNEVTEVVETVHGTKYVVEGPVHCPSRDDASIRSIWIVDKGSERPRLVSAYPL
jgi:hypothetical protein